MGSGYFDKLTEKVVVFRTVAYLEAGGAAFVNTKIRIDDRIILQKIKRTI